MKQNNTLSRNVARPDIVASVLVLTGIVTLMGMKLNANISTKKNVITVVYITEPGSDWKQKNKKRKNLTIQT